MEKKEDFSGLSIIEETNGAHLYPNFFISKKEEERICKTWR